MEYKEIFERDQFDGHKIKAKSSKRLNVIKRQENHCMLISNPSILKIFIWRLFFPFDLEKDSKNQDTVLKLHDESSIELHASCVDSFNW